MICVYIHISRDADTAHYNKSRRAQCARTLTIKYMKIITISKVGYNHPSQANWSWGIWKVDLLDTTRDYCMSYTTKENFGGDSRFKNKVKELKSIKVIETKGVLGTPNIKGVSKMPILDSDQFINEVLTQIK